MTTNSILPIDATPEMALRDRWRAISAASALRLLLVVIVLLVEATLPSAQTPRQLHHVAGDWWDAALVQQVGGRMRYFVLATAAMVVFLTRNWLRRESVYALEETSRTRFWWMLWLIPNLLFSTALMGSVPALTRWTSSADLEAWLELRATLTVAALITGALALMPAGFWRRWFSENRRAFLWATLLGFGTQCVSFIVDKVWRSASVPTLWAAAWGLRLLGHTVVADPEKPRLAVSGFRAIISPSCSGIEGIGLVGSFLGFYLWWYRDELRMPRALILLPIGIVAGWILNVVRIIFLMLIGIHNRRLALGGFHSAAGWILFNALCFAIVAASWRFESLSSSHPKIALRHSEATFYLMPLLVIAVTAMITHAMTSDFDTYYPLRVVATMAALLYFRPQLAHLQWRPTKAAIGLGALVFVVWVTLTLGGSSGSSDFVNGIREMSRAQAIWWIAFRIFGAVVTVPIAEELAFRGYLLRKFVSVDFETVLPRRYTWSAVIASSVLFGALHQEWIAGTSAGLVFVYAVYRRGSLGEAIYAHATANAMLAAYVLATGRWSLWE